MSKAKQMNMFGVNKAWRESTDEKYGILLANLPGWKPKQIPTQGLYGIRFEKFTTLSIQQILKDAGESCTFLEARELLSRLKIEGRLPEGYE